MLSGVGTQKATWCRRGPTPLVKAMSCTPPLRCVQAAHSCPLLGILGVFGHPEADLVVEGDGLVDIGREAVEVVDAQRLHALVERIFLVDRRQPVHLRIEFQRNAVRVARAEGARLVGPLDPLHRQALALEEMLGLVEVLIAKTP